MCWQRMMVYGRTRTRRSFKTTGGAAEFPPRESETEDEKQAQNELAIRGTFSGDSAVTALFRFPLFMRCIALECDPSFEVLT